MGEGTVCKTIIKGRADSEDYIVPNTWKGRYFPTLSPFLETGMYLLRVLRSVGSSYTEYFHGI